MGREVSGFRVQGSGFSTNLPRWQGILPLPVGEVGECNEPGEGFLPRRPQALTRNHEG